MSYAKQANREIFSQLDGIHSWGDFIREAEYTNEFVGHLGGWRGAASVLFDTEILRGNPPPSREAGQGAAGRVAPCLNGNGKAAGSATQQDAENGALIYAYQNVENPLVESEVSATLRARNSTDERSNGAYIIKGAAIGRKPENGEVLQDGSCYTLNCTERHAVAYGFNGDQSEKTRSMGEKEEQSPTLRADGPSHVSVVSRPLMATSTNSTMDSINETTTAWAWELNAVRRLTPRECERLQGFPDDFTRIPYRGKPASQCPDGPRYKALGNSMAVPVMRWIGEQIQRYEELKV